MSEDTIRTMEEERQRVYGTRKQPFVMFMTPAFDHKVTLGYMKSLIDTIQLLQVNGIKCGLQSFGGDPYLAKVRNLLVSVCLKRYPDATHLFFLDADLDWDAAAVLRIVNRMSLGKESVIAGVYPQKKDELNYPASILMDVKTQQPIDNDGLVKAEMVPTGFLCIRREVYEGMCEVSPRYKDSTGQGEECWNLFEMGFDRTNLEKNGLGDWWGEDFAFCRRLLNAGHEVWVDPDVDFGHHGAKTWRANYRSAVDSVRDGTATIVKHDTLKTGEEMALERAAD